MDCRSNSNLQIKDQLGAVIQMRPWAGPAYSVACIIYFSMFTTFAILFVTMFTLSNAKWPQLGLAIIALAILLDILTLKTKSRFTRSEFRLTSPLSEEVLSGNKWNGLVWTATIGFNAAAILFLLIAYISGTSLIEGNTWSFGLFLFLLSMSLVTLTAMSPVHTLAYSISKISIADYDFSQVALLAQKKIRAVGWALVAIVAASLVFGQIRLLSTSQQLPLLGYGLIRVYLSLAILLLASAPFFWRLHDTVMELKKHQKVPSSTRNRS